MLETDVGQNQSGGRGKMKWGDPSQFLDSPEEGSGKQLSCVTSLPLHGSHFKCGSVYVPAGPLRTPE